MSIQEHSVTADELFDLPDDGFQYEIHNGALIQMPPSGDEATGVGASLVALLWNYVVTNRLGRVTGADGAYVLSEEPNVTYAPDAAFIAKARVTGYTGKCYPTAPDLAVEVVSPTDRADKVQEKVENYLRYGTKVVWVIYPRTRSIVVHTSEAAHIVGQDGVLDGGDVLPGLSLAVRDVFAVLED